MAWGGWGWWGSSNISSAIQKILRQILPGGPTTAQVANGTLFASDGTAVTQNNSVSKYTQNSSGTLVYLQPWTNLLLSSVGSGSAWTFDGVTDATGVTDPNGGTTGQVLTTTAGNANHRAFQSFTATVSASYTISVYAQYVSGGCQFLGIGNAAGSTYNAVFDVKNNVFVPGNSLNVVTSSITPAANGWFRYSANVTASNGGGIFFQVSPGETTAVQSNGNAYNATGGKSINVWGFQEESTQRTSPMAYIPTTTVTVTQNPVCVEPSGAFVEGTSKNLLSWSLDLTNGWNTTNVTVSASSSLSPEALNNAFALVWATSGTDDRIFRVANIPATGQATYSIYAKSGSVNFLGMHGASVGAYTVFNLNTGAVATTVGNCTGSVFQVGTSGWYRVSMTEPVNSGAINVIFQVGDTAADTIPGAGMPAVPGNLVYLWGPQCENQSWASSYIPNTAVPVTRSADLISFPNPLTSPTPLVVSAKAAAYQGFTGNVAGNSRRVLVSSDGVFGVDSWYLFQDENAAASAIDLTMQVYDHLGQLAAGGSIANAAPPTPGDTLKGTLVGNTITVYRNGSVDGVLGTSVNGLQAIQAKVFIGSIQNATNNFNGWLTDISIGNTP